VRLTLLIDDFRHGLRRLLRARSFTLPAMFTVACGVGLGVSILGLLRLQSARPLLLNSALSLEPIRDAGWESSWAGPLRTAAYVQGARLDAMLLVLAIVAGLAILIACLNLGSLAYARASARQHELAVQAALGASRRRLRSRLLSEGLWLAVAGGGLGLLLGIVGSNVMFSTWPHAAPSFEALAVEAWALTIGLGIPMAATILLPVLASGKLLRRPDVGPLVVAGARTTATRAQLVLRDGLAVTQLAASVALIIGAGLLIRGTLSNEGNSPVAFEVRDTLSVELDLAGAGYAESHARLTYYEGLLDRVGQLPSVEAETLSSPGLLLGFGPEILVTAECGNCSMSGIYMPMQPAVVRHHSVSPGFFGTASRGPVQGREFTADDRMGAPLVALVNPTFAREHFEGGQPIGKRVQVGGMRGAWYTVVGVVEDVGAGIADHAGSPMPAMYVSLFQEPPLSADLNVRANGALAALVPAVEGAVSAGASIARIGTVEERFEYHAAPFRWLGFIFGAAGLLTLILAAHGLFAVMRYNVIQRKRELGIRMALGARGWTVLGMIVRRGLVLVGLGGAVGIWAALPLIGLLKNLVPGISVLDPTLFGGVVLLLGLSALAGSALPAWAAAHLDPAISLQGQ
jgi:predicted permease